ncbi:hypothetical protein P4829_19215 [Bacillus atrophaeus]|uniref:hypothetical protein n=1 Tax=Bacillus atrophaeus TaxID=1452 RepID=UPI000AFC53AE|nr:hypothetical protein [Bacillus atrophaeus]WFE13949.1 hypothetical protein P4829_19215 [Bacillus atrophaeus]
MLLIGEISCIKRLKSAIGLFIEADVEETRKQYEKDIEDMGECGNCFNFYAAVNELPF